MSILKAYKYRLYPTKLQRDYLGEVFGSVRFVWNQLVANFNEYSSVGPNRQCNEKLLKTEYPFLNNSISYALQQKRMDFDETKSQFFSKTRKTKLGQMKFKKKGLSKDSFRIPGQAIGYNKCINFESGSLKIPKMTPLKIVIDRKFDGIVRSITVSKNKVDQYFVSILVEEDQKCLQNTGNVIGIDLGLKDIFIFDDGTKVRNPKWFRESQSKLAKQQKHLSRKVKGSNRYKKQRLKVAKTHLKIANQRVWFLHNISTWIVKNNDIIITENLNISGMMRNHKLAKSISDASWSEFIRMLRYKAAWYGRTFHQIDRFFASSKTCGSCGHKLDTLDLSVREWECPSCHSIHDRDTNAAKNILDKGLSDLYGLSSAELADRGRSPQHVRGEVLDRYKGLHPNIGIFVEANTVD